MRLAGRRLVGALLDFDAQHAVGVGVGRAWDAAMECGEGRGAPLPGEPHAARHLGDHAYLGEGLLLAGDQQDVRVVAHGHRQGDRHPGKHHGVVQGDESESVHDGYRINSIFYVVNHW